MFLSHVHDDVRDDVHRLLIFLYRIVDIIISVTKQMEAAESNVCRGGLQNENENFKPFTGQWRLLSAWRVMLNWSCIYHQRTGSLRS